METVGNWRETFLVRTWRVEVSTDPEVGGGCNQPLKYTNMIFEIFLKYNEKEDFFKKYVLFYYIISFKFNAHHILSIMPSIASPIVPKSLCNHESAILQVLQNRLTTDTFYFYFRVKSFSIAKILVIVKDGNQKEPDQANKMAVATNKYIL